MPATTARQTSLPSRSPCWDYVEALSAVPPPSARKTIEGLQGLGWSDAAILDMTQVAAYYAFVNRIAEGLGVELEDRWPDEIKAGGRAD